MTPVKLLIKGAPNGAMRPYEAQRRTLIIVQQMPYNSSELTEWSIIRHKVGTYIANVLE